MRICIDFVPQLLSNAEFAEKHKLMSAPISSVVAKFHRAEFESPSLFNPGQFFSIRSVVFEIESATYDFDTQAQTIRLGLIK